MPSVLSRLFATFAAASLASIVQASDVSYYGILKVQEFAQSTTNATPVAVSNGFSFHAFAVGATNGALTNATVRRTSTAVTNTLLPRGGDLLFEFEDRFLTQTALDNAYPSGSIFSPVNYAVTMRTLNDGEQTQNLSFGTVFGTPVTPQIANLAEGQAIDTTREFILKWNSLGGSSVDIVQATILDAGSNVVFSSPAPFQPGALNGASVSVTVPANTLPAGAELTGHVTVAKPGLPNTSYATGVPAFSRDTRFPLLTRAAPAQPRLSIAATPFGPELTFSTEANRVYHLQTSPTLGPWSDVLVTNATTDGVRFIDSAAGPQAGFYRVQVGP